MLKNSQLNKNLSAANKMIKTAVKEPASKPTPKPTSDNKKPPEKLTKQPTKEKINKESEKLMIKTLENSEKSFENTKEEEENEKKTPIENNKKAPIKKKITKDTEELSQGITSLDKIINKKPSELEIPEISHKNLSKITKKKRGKNLADRQNMIESHDFESFLKKTEDLSYGDDEYKFKDCDYLINVDTDEENIDNDKYLGSFSNGDLVEELIKRVEWVEMTRVSDESRLARFINFNGKHEANWRQKIIMGKLEDNSCLK